MCSRVKLPVTHMYCARLLSNSKNLPSNSKNLPSNSWLTKCLQSCRGIHVSVALHHEPNEEMMKKRQAEMMGRGLPKRKPIKGVKNILLVASGKGGVGKSTTAVNVAAALKAEDPRKNIGLLDTDVFGPSIPLMMNLDESPLLSNNNLMVPLQNYGVKCMSMGFLVKKDSPVIWRGLMVMQAIDRLLHQVEWDLIDYLVIDTPPGTGDTHLSLVQNIPVTGVLLVTTPQTAALQVTLRGANMFRKLNIPILGIIQNMSSIECPTCKSQVHLQSNGAQALLRDLDVPLLANIPLDNAICQGSDDGIPVVVSSPNGPQALAYRKVAQKIIQDLDGIPADK